jgi:hypothetical protein
VNDSLWLIITSLAAALSALLVGVGLIFAAKQLKILTRSARLSYVLDLHREFGSIRKQRKFVTEELPALLAGCASPADLPSAVDQQLFEVATYFERVGSLAKHGLIETDLILDLLGPAVSACWKELDPVVEVWKTRLGPRAYENFEGLASLSGQWLERNPERDIDELVRRMDRHRL